MAGNIENARIVKLSSFEAVRIHASAGNFDTADRVIAVSGLLYPEAWRSSRPDSKEGRPGTKHNRAYLS
jgi:hypothetical protein